MQLVAPTEVTASKHLSSSDNFIAGQKEKFSICFFFLNSKVSRGFVFVC